MKLADLLTVGRVHVRPELRSVEEAVSSFLKAGGEDPSAPGERPALGSDSGSAGEGRTSFRISPTTLLVKLPSTGGDPPTAGLWVSQGPLASGREAPEGSEEPGPKILLILRTSRAGKSLAGSRERLARILRDPTIESQLLSARTAEEVLGIRKLMEVRLDDPMRVEDVLIPLPYRVFQDTPLSEVVDLMARKGLQALPVVGEDLRVLGVVTAGEALKHALQRRVRGAEEGTQRPMGTARDAMSRTVMCVSEDQDLMDAAQIMANKGVGQLPVVREGGIVGILTRDAVLGALFGGR